MVYFKNVIVYSFVTKIDEDLTARINMADAKFSFQEKGRVYYPAWMSPEGNKYIYFLKLPHISMVIFPSAVTDM